MNYLVVTDEENNVLMEGDYVWCVIQDGNDDVGAMVKVHQNEIWPNEQINESSKEVSQPVNDENTSPNIDSGKHIENQILQPIPGTSNILLNDKIQWDSNATKLLLDMYSSHLQNVGPFKHFADKKTLYKYIAEELYKKLSFKCIGAQCEQRIKTVLRKRSSTVAHNQTSGNTFKKIEYEEELSKLKAIDDSVEPDVLMGIGISKVGKDSDLSVIPNKKQKKDPNDVKKEMEETQNRLQAKSHNKKSNRTFQEVYEEVQKTKEENRKEWRREKLSAFKEYATLLVNSNDKRCTHCSEEPKP